MIPTPISKAINAQVRARTIDVSRRLNRLKNENAYPPRTPKINPAMNSSMMKPARLMSRTEV